MSQSASQAAAFFREVARHRVVWFVRDDQGSPAPRNADGRRTLPYWSSEARGRRAADVWGHGLRAASMPLDTWRREELARLADEEHLVGVNWTGPRLVGWEFTVAEVENRLRHALQEGPYAPGTR